MALSYKMIFEVPDAMVTFGNIQLSYVAYQRFFEFPADNPSGPFTVIDQINSLFANSTLALFGGSISISTSVSPIPDPIYGAVTIYTVDWTGLTSDPALDDTKGEFVSCALDRSTDGTVYFYYSALVLSEARCIDEGLCPDCPEPTPIDTTPCDICYDVTTDPCGETIFLPGLDADTTYTLTMTDNNAGVSYNYEVTTDETGEASVIIADFPVGAFSTFSNYTVTIVDEDGNPAQVTIGYTTYDCYNLIFTPSTTVTPQT
jgi:hypothetical protein